MAFSLTGIRADRAPIRLSNWAHIRGTCSRCIVDLNGCKSGEFVEPGLRAQECASCADSNSDIPDSDRFCRPRISRACPAVENARHWSRRKKTRCGSKVRASEISRCESQETKRYSCRAQSDEPYKCISFARNGAHDVRDLLASFIRPESEW